MLVMADDGNVIWHCNNCRQFLKFFQLFSVKWHDQNDMFIVQFIWQWSSNKILFIIQKRAYYVRNLFSCSHLTRSIVTLVYCMVFKILCGVEGDHGMVRPSAPNCKLCYISFQWQPAVSLYSVLCWCAVTLAIP